jgi:hypothetical protein
MENSRREGSSAGLKVRVSLISVVASSLVGAGISERNICPAKTQYHQQQHQTIRKRNMKPLTVMLAIAMSSLGLSARADTFPKR